ncbi:MAG: hypothetical protein AABY31_02075, partial [Thermoproteota archaeon]
HASQEQSTARELLIADIKKQIDNYETKGHITILIGDMNDVIQHHSKPSKWLEQLTMDTAMTDTLAIRHPLMTDGYTYTSNKGNNKKIDHIIIDNRHKHFVKQAGIIHDSSKVLDHSTVFATLSGAPRADPPKQDRINTVNWTKEQTKEFMDKLGPLLAEIAQNETPKEENQEEWKKWQNNCYEQLTKAYGAAASPIKGRQGKKWMNKQMFIWTKDVQQIGYTIKCWQEKSITTEEAIKMAKLSSTEESKILETLLSNFKIEKKSDYIITQNGFRNVG